MNKPYETGLWVAIIAGVFCPTLVTFAQNPSSAPQTADQAGVTIVRVIVTGSNIPTAEEVGPNPVDTYRPADIENWASAMQRTDNFPAAGGGRNHQPEHRHGGDGTVQLTCALAGQETSC
jgi:hypothetical protein